jgi:DNA-binding response OmpR family regulator
MEARLLAVLLRDSNETVSRATLIREVWQTDFLDDTRTLDVHIRWLREKIEKNPSRPRWLMTVRGVGYRLIV